MADTIACDSVGQLQDAVQFVLPDLSGEPNLRGRMVVVTKPPGENSRCVAGVDRAEPSKL